MSEISGVRFKYNVNILNVFNHQMEKSETHGTGFSQKRTHLQFIYAFSLKNVFLFIQHTITSKNKG